MTEEEKIYTRDEAAAYLRVCLSTVDGLVRNKKISFTRIGDPVHGRVVFQPSDLKAFLAREKKFTIRDSVKEIMMLIPPGALKRNLAHDLSGFADLIGKVKKILQAMGWEIEAEAWHDPETIKKIKILAANLEAVIVVAEVVTDHSIDFIWRLALREMELWEKEILPNLKLNKKYFDIGKLKNIELLAILGHQMERQGQGFSAARPWFIKIAGERYLISDKNWTPIPPLDPSDEANFFAQRELFKIRVAPKTSKPISEREKAEAAEKAKVESAENKLQLESELLAGE